MKILAKPNTPEWDELRTKGIGSSEAAGAADVSEWPDSTPRALYHRKRGEIPPKEQNDAMRRGHLLEPIIVEEFAHETGLPIQQYPVGLVQHPQHPVVLATPDAVLSAKAGLECKSVNFRMAQRLGGEGTDELPNDWLCQAQQQMAVCGWERVHFAVWIDRDTFKTFIVERNEQAIEILIQAEVELWARIEAGDPPPETWTAASVDLMKALYREVHSDQIIELGGRRELWTRYKLHQLQAKSHTKQAEAFKAELLSHVGNAACAILDDKKMLRRKKMPATEVVYVKKEFIDVREVNIPKEVQQLLEERKAQIGDGNERDQDDVSREGAGEDGAQGGDTDA